MRVPNLTFFEDLFETDFRDLQITVSDKPRQYHAAAFAFGNNVFVQPEYWEPASSLTTALLAHELAHVVQFRQGRVKGSDRMLMDADLEYEAELASDVVLGKAAKRQIASLTGSTPVSHRKAVHVLCRPDWVGDTWQKGKKRPGWAGNVTIRFEELVPVNGLPIVRPVQVVGIIAPSVTKGRASAPEPISGLRVSAAADVPARYRYNPETGENARNTGIVDAHKGHIMALELGGPDIPENIVPQFANWQANGEWRQLEKDLENKASELQKTGEYLEFDCTVYYKKYEDYTLGSQKGLTFPTGFKVVATILNKAKQPQTNFINKTIEPRQDETDDMMAIRTMERAERVDDPSYKMEDHYDDIRRVSKTEKGKQKETLQFVDDGQNSRYRPSYRQPTLPAIPPIRYDGPDNKNALDTRMQRQSLDLLHDRRRKDSLSDDGSDSDYVMSDGYSSDSSSDSRSDMDVD
jgi:uncharacterized protein DUF4157/DNA/RNA non-specific endonuclease